MQAMVQRERDYVLCGTVQVDDTYLGGGTAGRGSENKVPFIGVVSVDQHGHPLRAKFTPVLGFTRQAIAAWAGDNLSPANTVASDGLQPQFTPAGLDAFDRDRAGGAQLLSK